VSFFIILVLIIHFSPQKISYYMPFLRKVLILISFWFLLPLLGNSQFAEPRILTSLNTDNPIPINLNDNSAIDIIFANGTIYYDFETEFRREVIVQNITFKNPIAVDLDLDGTIEILNETPNYGLEVLKIDSLGQLISQSNALIGGGTFQLRELADINNDGYLDLIAKVNSTNAQSPTPKINDGTGHFVNPSTLSYNNFVAMADVNGDGWKDILYMNLVDLELNWRRAWNIGENFVDEDLLSFITPNFTELMHIHVFDQNDDGFDDLLLNIKENSTNTRPRVLLNANIEFGNYSLAPPFTYQGSFTAGMSLDFDYDGDLDFYYNSSSTSSPSFIVFNSDGSELDTIQTVLNDNSLRPIYLPDSEFPHIYKYIDSPSLTEYTFDTDVSNFRAFKKVYGFNSPAIKIHNTNEDTLPDLVFYNTKRTNQFLVKLERNPETEEFDPIAPVHYNYLNGHTIPISDVNNDGQIDFLSIDYDSTSANGLHISQPDGTYTLAYTINETCDYNSLNNYGYTIHPQIIDLDENGELDIIIQQESNECPLISLVQISGEFFPLNNYLDQNVFGHEYFCLDIENDGDLDVLMTKGMAIQTGPLEFELLTYIYKSEETEALMSSVSLDGFLVADINLDGYDDFVLQNLLFLNDTNNKFENPQQVVADNGYFDNDLPYYYTFQSYHIISSSNEHYFWNNKSELIDFDGDEDLDFICHDADQNLLVKNQGDSLYLPSAGLSTIDGGPFEQTDWDNDSDQDLIMISNEGDVILIENLNQHPNSIKGVFFLDLNNNGIFDDGENFATDAQIGSDSALSAWTLEDGRFQLAFSDTGSYTIQAEVDDFLYTFTTPSELTFTLDSDQPQVNNVHIGIIPTGNSYPAAEILFGTNDLLYPFDEGALAFCNADTGGKLDFYTLSGVLYIQAADQMDNQTIPTGWETIVGEVADFNGDGSIDFLAEKEGQLYLVLNVNNTTFEGSIITESCGEVFVQDLNQDGAMDFILECSTATQLYMNNGEGSFTMQNGYYFEDLTVYFDFDLDGLKDIIKTANGVSKWRKNLGHPNYGPLITLTNVIIDDQTKHDLHDFDNDGDLDKYNGTSWSENLDNANFSTSYNTLITAPSGYSYTHPKIFTDIDGDSYKDIIVYRGASYTDRCVYYINNGDNTFSSPNYLQVPSVPYGPYRMLDYDDNGTLDLIFEAYETNFPHPNYCTSTRVLPLGPDGPEPMFVIQTAVIPERTYIQELNNNDTRELLMWLEGEFGNPHAESIRAIYNTGNNVAAGNQVKKDVPWASNSSIPFNMNQDDLIDYYDIETRTFYTALSDESYIPHLPLFESGWCCDFALAADIDNDGDDDLCLIEAFDESKHIYVNNNGLFEDHIVYVNFPFANVLDVDQNGLNDFVVSGATYLQTANYQFTLQLSNWFNTKYSGDGLSSWDDTYDFNNDQIPDVFWTENDSLFCALNLNPETYTPVFIALAPNHNYTVFDLNGDDFDDIIINKGLQISYVLSNGDGSFQKPQIILDNFLVTYMNHLDWDGDGDDDLIYGGRYPYGQGRNGIYWLETLISSHRFIKGSVFLDENANGVREETEVGLSNWELQLGSTNNTAFTNALGNFSFDLTIDDTYNVEAVIPENWTITTPSNVLATVNESNPIANNIDFGVLPNNLFTALEPSIQTTSLVCDNTGYIMMQITNTGTNITEFDVALIIPEEFSFTNASPAQDSLSGDTIYWHIDALPPTQHINIFAGALAPNFSFMGDSFTFEMITTTIEDQPLTYYNSFTNQTLLCAYDPNDKTTLTGFTQEGYVGTTDTLDYLIRFQNTGNYYAQNIDVVDQLSDHLDWGSLHVISASHDVQTNVNDNGQVTFSFNDIMLPDSTTDEPRSHGFVRFRIQPNQSSEHLSIIENTAEIYFDSNPAVITNTTFNTIYDCDEFVAVPTATSEPECFLQVVTLNVTSDWFESVVWQNGEEIIANTAITEIENVNSVLTLTVTIDNALCDATSANLVIEPIVYDLPFITAPATIFCQNEELELSVNTNETILWYNDGIYVATGPTLQVTASGVYTVIVDEENCDTPSTNAVDITMLPSPQVGPIVQEEDQLIVLNIPNTTYQWFEDGTAIVGANTSTLYITENGIYSVVATNTDNCSTTSVIEVQDVSYSGLTAPNIDIYPNPAQDQLTIVLPQEKANLTLYDITGRTCLQMETNTRNNTIDLTSLAKACYTLKIEINDETWNIRIIKE
jgi:hypothetical protein